MNNDFPRILSLLRKEKQLSQKQVAADLDIAQALLSHYEKGKRECGLDFLIKAADYYSVSTDYLLGRSAVMSGVVLAPDDISGETAADGKYGTLPLSATLTKTLVINSIEVIYSLLAQTKNIKFVQNISTILSVTVYKLFRLVYKTNFNNGKQFFGISDESALRCSDACVFVAEGKTLKILAENNEILPPITTNSLESGYNKQATALLNLIRNCESYLKDYDKE